MNLTDAEILQALEALLDMDPARCTMPKIRQELINRFKKHLFDPERSLTSCLPSR